MTGATSAMGEVKVSGVDERDDHSVAVDLTALCSLAADVLRREGIDVGTLDVHLVDAEQMAELNREYMGHEGPTDVLSFPLDGVDELGPELDLPPEASMLGDIVLCPEVAAAQASGHVGDLTGELQLLVIHGVLHVLGHDHAEPDETKQMQDRERVHLAAIGVRHPEPA